MCAWTDIADLATKAARDTFKFTVTYTHNVGGAAEVIAAPFDAACEVIRVTDNGQVTEYVPVIDVRLADLTTAPVVDDTCVIGAKSYRIIDVQKGGVGIDAKLFLMEL